MVNKAEGNQDYMKLLNEVLCGAKKLKEIYDNPSLGKENFEIELGGVKINPSGTGTRAIYSYLYRDVKDNNPTFEKVNRFIETFAKLSKAFETPAPVLIKDEGVQIYKN